MELHERGLLDYWITKIIKINPFQDKELNDRLEIVLEENKKCYLTNEKHLAHFLSTFEISNLQQAIGKPVAAMVIDFNAIVDIGLYDGDIDNVKWVKTECIQDDIFKDNANNTQPKQDFLDYFLFKRNKWTAYELWLELNEPCDSYEDWIKEYFYPEDVDTCFIENEHFTPFEDQHINKINYQLTHECAKHLAIMAPSNIGLTIRKLLLRHTENIVDEKSFWEFFNKIFKGEA